MPVTATLSVPDADTETVPLTVEAVGAVTVAVGAVESVQDEPMVTVLVEDVPTLPQASVAVATIVWEEPAVRAEVFQE